MRQMESKNFMDDYYKHLRSTLVIKGKEEGLRMWAMEQAVQVRLSPAQWEDLGWGCLTNIADHILEYVKKEDKGDT